MNQQKLSEIVDYAGTVLDVNPSARSDFALLMERVDDEFGVYDMARSDEYEIEYAIASKYFH